MVELKRVLVATDGSDHGFAAVVTGAALGQRTGASVELATIVEVLLLPPPYVPPGVNAAAYEWELIKEAREKAKEQARAAGAADATIHVRAGLAPQLVNKIAEERDAELIVVGANPQPALARSLVGSTGRRVLYLANRPVLVANTPRREPFRRILAAIDLSEASASVLESAWAIARADEAELRALFALEPLPMMLAKVARFKEEERLARAVSELERVLNETGLGSQGSVSGRTREGNAGPEILEEAQEWDADLIVLGTHGFGFFDRLMLGSTPLHVLRHGNRATLIVPSVGTGG